MNEIDPDAILRERLGPVPVSVLSQLIEQYPDMLAVAVIIQLADESFIVASGGCTVLETVGLFHFGILESGAALSERSERG